MKKLFTFLFIFISFNIFVSQNTFASSLFVADLKESISIYPNPIATNATIKISNEINLQESNVNVVFYNKIACFLQHLVNVLKAIIVPVGIRNINISSRMSFINN